MDVRVGLWRKLSAENLMLLNCGLEKTLESPLDCKEIQPVHPKGHQSWVFIGGTDVEAETPVLWPTHAKSWLIGKDPDAGRDWEQEEKGTSEDEIGWMASPTQWAWVWVNSRSWWWTGRPGMLLFMGSQIVGCDWTTELNWTDDMSVFHIENHQMIFHKIVALYNSTVHLGPYISTSLLTFYFLFCYLFCFFFSPFFMIALLRNVMWCLIVVLNYILLLISDISLVLMCLLFNCVSSFGKCLSKAFAHFWIDLSIFLLLNIMSINRS